MQLYKAMKKGNEIQGNEIERERVDVSVEDAVDVAGTKFFCAVNRTKF